MLRLARSTAPIIGLAMLLHLPATVYAQQEVDDSETPVPLETTGLDQDLPPIAENPHAPLIERFADDSEVTTAYRNWVIAYYARQKNILSERERAFGFQQIIGYVAFLLSHALLGLAVWCAFREFLHAAKMRKTAANTDQDQDSDESGRTNEIKVSLEGIALKTSFHGTFLLVIAIVFYFLYLKFVYPINELSG